MTNSQIVNLEEIIEEICGEITDYEQLAEEVVDGDQPELVAALVEWFSDDIPYGVITGDTETSEEWIADRIAGLE